MVPTIVKKMINSEATSKKRPFTASFVIFNTLNCPSRLWYDGGWHVRIIFARDETSGREGNKTGAGDWNIKQYLVFLFISMSIQ